MATDDRTAIIEQLQRLAEFEPQTHTFARLAELYRRSGERERALDVVRDGLKHHPYYLEARLLHARLLLALGREEPARAEFEHILTLDPANPLACMALGVERVAAQADGPGGGALAEWLGGIDEAWRGENADPGPLPADRANRTDRADRANRTVAEPGRGIETATLAELYTRQGLFDRAIGVYEQMLEGDPGNADLVAALTELRSRTEGAPASASAGSMAAPVERAKRGAAPVSIREQLCRILDADAVPGSD